MSADIPSALDRCSRRGTQLAVAFAAAAVLAVAPSALAASAPAKNALATVKQLTVKPLGSKVGYDRKMFGAPWADVDHNGCKTRDDILKRDLTAVTFEAGSSCVVKTGTLDDPYTGLTLHFVHGPNSTLVQIDHVVALGDAWVTGASAWTTPQRTLYANDPVVLLAVQGSANESKGDDDASQWLPTHSVCMYVERQIVIKKKYALWVTAAEKAAMVKTLNRC